MRASREAQPISLEEEAPPLGSEWPVGISQARREVKRQEGGRVGLEKRVLISRDTALARMFIRVFSKHTSYGKT